LPGSADDPVAAVMERQGRARAQQAVAAETLVVDGLRIVARAPISVDSLRVLLRKLRR
jgi:hypothetical protein